MSHGGLWDKVFLVVGGGCGLILVSSEVLDEKKIVSCCFKSTQKEVMGGPGGCVALTSRSAQVCECV